MAKRIIYDENARRALEKGMDILAEAVARHPLAPKAATSYWRKSLALPKSLTTGSPLPKRLNWKITLKTPESALIRQAASKTNDAAR